MIKNKQHIKHLAQEIKGHLEVMRELDTENDNLQFMCEVSKYIMDMLLDELEKQND
jgi:hypothetical protein